MSQQSQTEDNAFTLSGRKTGVRERREVSFIDDDGSCHNTYAAAYQSSVKKKHVDIFGKYSYCPNEMVNKLLEEFVVAFK